MHSPRKRPNSAALKSFIKPGVAAFTSPSKRLDTDGKAKESKFSNSPAKERVGQQNTLVTPLGNEHSVLVEIQPNGTTGLQQSNQKHASRDKPKPPKKNGKSPWALQSRAKSVDLASQYFEPPREKENTTPPPRNSMTTDFATPIWAQFTSSSPADHSSRMRSSRSLSPTKMATDSLSDDSLASTATVERHKNERMGSYTSNQLLEDNSHHQCPERGRTKHREEPKYPDSLATMPAGSSKVQETVALYNSKSNTSATSQKTRNSAELDAALEAVLVAQNIPLKIRENMKNVDAKIKEDFIKNAGSDLSKASSSSANTSKASPQKSVFGAPGMKLSTMIRARSRSRGPDKEAKDEEELSSPTKRGRSWSRALPFGKNNGSPQKRPRSLSRPRSLMSLKNFSSSSVNSLGVGGCKDSKEQGPALSVPEDFISYLQEEKKPQNVEVGKLHKLRILLRNEAVSWVDRFVALEGMNQLVGLLKRVLEIEWREEHEDLLLHELLLCLKALCTTQKALDKLMEVESTLIPDLLQMLFDKERRGPSEFTTRGLVITILFNHLAAAKFQNISTRAKALLIYLSDQASPEDERPVGFVDQMRQSRPYQSWCREISNVTKEVFWIFLHHQNIVPLANSEDGPPNEGEGYIRRHFPRERPPVPAAPYIGGVEWDATNYLGIHLDLLNALIASLDTKTGRNQLREDLKASGFEKLMGETLRLCKEKFYGAVHEGLKTWVSAANEDGWDVSEVRTGPKSPETSHLPKKTNKKAEPPPRLELLSNLSLQARRGERPVDDGYGWI